MGYKCMTAEQSAEIVKLCNEGYGEAIAAYGRDCAKSWGKGYLNGCVTGILAFAAICGVLGLVGAVEDVVEKKRDNKTKEENT